MTPEEYTNTIRNTINTNNRIINDNQTLQNRLLTMLENAYLANNSYINANTNNNIYNINNTTTTPPIRQRQGDTNSIIQDYVFSYIFEPHATTINTRTAIDELPTNAQIANSTNSIIYDASNIEFTTHVCPITLTDFVNGENLLCIRQCHHIFKESSLMNWFSRSARCPLCRYDIREYVIESDEQQRGEEDEDDPPSTLNPIDDINNIYRTPNTRTRSFTPLIRNFTSNIPETLTNEIADIFTNFLQNSGNNNR
jgi:hypothetical protein